MRPKERVMNTLEGDKVDRIPVFSGMGNVTVQGMEKYNIDFSSSHQDAEMMSRLACSTYELFGFECAVVPFDLGVEAEALGCEVNFYPGKEQILYPTIKTKLLEEVEKPEVPDELGDKGRVPLVKEAIGRCKEILGNEVAVGSYVLGPYTLAGQILELDILLKNSFKSPREVGPLLDELVKAVTGIANEYAKAGADYIAVREMGAPSDIISPRLFKTLVQPPLKKAVSGIDAPTILHMCGDTNMLVEMLHEVGANAISVEQKNDVAQSREKLGQDAVLLGNIDPFDTLIKGAREEVEKEVKAAIEGGVDGIMPGCDIWPEVPEANMRALVESTERYGKK